MISFFDSARLCDVIVCVRVCVCACMHACVCVREREREFVYTRWRMRKEFAIIGIFFCTCIVESIVVYEIVIICL